MESDVNTGKWVSKPTALGMVSGHTDVRHKVERTRNVVAMVEGNDPELRSEYVIIGAHYDHLGMGGPGSGSREPDTTAVHNGADDNASGVAGMLEIAQRLASEKTNRRSVVFIAFGAEEMGLLGAKHFVDHPLVPLRAVQAMINFDMIGRMNAERKVMVGGTGTSAESESILDALGKKRKFELSYSSEGFGASDHAAFYVKDIPVFFITTGAHDDYHTSRDDAALLDYASAGQVAEFGFDLLSELASRERRLAFQEAGPKARGGHGRGYKIALGIMPDFAGSGSNGLRVDAVRPEGPAGIAGMLKGDVITAINGKSVGNIYDYMARLKGLEKGMTITLDILREERRQVLIVQL
jgi:Zn-dependent M28 family amino/carboxypeptidase